MEAKALMLQAVPEEQRSTVASMADLIDGVSDEDARELVVMSRRSDPFPLHVQ